MSKHADGEQEAEGRASKKLKRKDRHRLTSSSKTGKSAANEEANEHTIDTKIPGKAPEDNVASSTAEPSKKRKRKAEKDSELEINVDLPEPPSKKALRKAKKRKTSKESTSNGHADERPLVEKPAGHSQEQVKPEGSKESHQTTVAPIDPLQNAAQKPSKHAVWIGNLPFTITKPMLCDFFSTRNGAPNSLIPASNITRIHLPAPQNAKATKTTLKPQNKGFAYVDFSSGGAFRAALDLSESVLGGRNVLIKDAKDFAGRPDKPKTAGSFEGEKSVGEVKNQKPTNKVFVGNLGFDVNVEDVRAFYDKCGTVVDVKLATFEDTGKCKGYGWVVFDCVEAAEAAVRGWVVSGEHGENGDEQESADEPIETEAESTSKVKIKDQKPRKWFVNRLQGRQVRCEFAESADLRYKKRFGKNAMQRDQLDPGSSAKDGLREMEQAHDDPRTKALQEDLSWTGKKKRRDNFAMNPGAPTDRSKRRGK